MATDDKTILKIKDNRQIHYTIREQGYIVWVEGEGDARNDSDWDILILLDKDRLEQADYDNVSYPFVLLGCDLGTEINPILYTKKNGNRIILPHFTRM